MKDRNFTSKTYYSNTHMASYGHKYWYYLTIGSRGRGKTYSAKKYILKRYRYGPLGTEDFFAWIRLTDAACLKVLQNNGATFFERELLDKYRVQVKVENDDIYFGDIPEAGQKPNYIFVGKVMSLQGYYKWKGNHFDGYNTIIMDELVRAESEKRTFNIPKAFVHEIENISRERKNVRCFIFCNAISEMTDIQELFGFIPSPGMFGVYKLFHKRAIIEYLDDSKEWRARKKVTMAGVLAEDSAFTNVYQESEYKYSFIVPRKNVAGRRHLFRLRIDKMTLVDLYTFNNGLIYVDSIDYYNGHSQHPTYALASSLAAPGVNFNKSIIKFIQSMAEQTYYRFPNNTLYSLFYNELVDHHIVH